MIEESGGPDAVAKDGDEHDVEAMNNGLEVDRSALDTPAPPADDPVAEDGRPDVG